MNGKQLKNSILQWAIQGKLVPQDPNDEPASVLLERIRKEKERLVKEKKIKKDKNASVIFRGEDSSYYEKFLATGEVKCIDEEIPFEIPGGWEWCRLKSIGVTETGTTPAKSHPEYFGNTIPFYGPGNIQDNKISCVTQGISEQGLPFSRIVPPNTILQVCIGGSIGKTAIVDSECSFNQQINSLTVHDGINTLYAFYVLISGFFKQQIMDKSTGTATPIINRSNWENLLIPIPPNVEQQQIIDKLAELLPIVEKYNKSQYKLDELNVSVKEQLQKSILQEAIQGKLVPQIAEEGIAEELLADIRREKELLVKEGKLKKSALTDSVIFKGDDNRYYEQIGSEVVDLTDDIPFEIPQTWKWCRLGTIVKMRIGKTPPRGEQVYWSNGTHDWVSISDMVEGGTIKTVKEKVSDMAVNEIFKCYPSPKGSLLMSFKLTVGRTSILGIDAYHNEAIITIVPYTDVDNIFRNYLLYILPIISNSGDSKDAIKGKTLNNKSLNNLLIPLPPLFEQKRIIAKIELVNSQIKG